MATPNNVPNKDDPKKNPEPNRAGTDVNKNVAKVEERSEEQRQEDEEKRAQEDEQKAYKARMDYATKISDHDDHSFDPLIIGENDWVHVNALVSDGLAQLRAKQIGMETENWIELTPEGERAVQAYNTKED